MPKLGLTELFPKLAWPKYFYQGLNRQYFRKVLAERPIAYWPLWEASGSVAYDISGNGFHGAYSGVTLGQDGIGDGRSCPSFDGSAGYVNVYSTGFRDALNGAAGTIAGWARAAAASVWDDGDLKAILRFAATSDNDIQLRIQGVNTFRWRYFADGSVSEVDTGSLSTLDWFHLALTWDKAANEMKAYLNGAQTWTTQTIANVWDGVLTSAGANIGAYSTTPNLLWYGWLQHWSVFDKVLSGQKILGFYSV